MTDLEIEQAQRAHDSLDKFNLSMNENMIRSADAVLRNCLLINGGAAVAILAFMGTVISKDAGSHKIIEDIAGGMTYFDVRPDAESPPAPAAKPRAARKPVEPTPIPTPAEAMPGMSRATAALYLAAAGGVMPTPPDFSKPSYACDRGRLAELVKLADAGDAAGLRAYGIRVFYSGAQALDRFRHRAIIAIEARQASRAAAE